jgi:plasmid maintenance system killer protein
MSQGQHRHRAALDVPRYRLHPLKSDLMGLWPVTVRANWRTVFRFEGIAFCFPMG